MSATVSARPAPSRQAARMPGATAVRPPSSKPSRPRQKLRELFSAHQENAHTRAPVSGKSFCRSVRAGPPHAERNLATVPALLILGLAILALRSSSPPRKGRRATQGRVGPLRRFSLRSRRGHPRSSARGTAGEADSDAAGSRRRGSPESGQGVDGRRRPCGPPCRGSVEQPGPAPPPTAPECPRRCGAVPLCGTAPRWGRGSQRRASGQALTRPAGSSSSPHRRADVYETASPP